MKQSLQALATRFVNLRRATLPDFLKEYRQDIRPSCQTTEGLTWIIQNLQEAWTRSDANSMLSAEKIIREILFSVRVAKMWGGVWYVEETPYPNEQNESDPFSRPAFVLRIGEDGIKFQRRDILDDIVYVVFKAAARGLLRTCKGHSQGWRCPTPLLIADEKRRVYCFMSCGDEAKSKAKTRWWRENLGSKKGSIRKGKRGGRAKR